MKFYWNLSNKNTKNIQNHSWKSEGENLNENCDVNSKNFVENFNKKETSKKTTFVKKTIIKISPIKMQIKDN